MAFQIRISIYHKVAKGSSRRLAPGQTLRSPKPQWGRTCLSALGGSVATHPAPKLTIRTRRRKRELRRNVWRMLGSMVPRARRRVAEGLRSRPEVVLEAIDLQWPVFGRSLGYCFERWFLTTHATVWSYVVFLHLRCDLWQLIMLPGDDLTFDSTGGLWSMGADAFFLCCHFVTLAQTMYVAGRSPLCTTTECF